MRFLISAAITFTLVVATIVVVNAAIDPGGLLNGAQKAQAVAEKLLKGHPVPLSNSDDRRLVEAYAAQMHRTPEILVVGSSRMMQVRKSVTTGQTFFNAAVNSMTLEDLLGVVWLFIQRKHRPKQIIIGIDPWLFDAQPRNNRWHALSKSAHAMRTALGHCCGPRSENGAEHPLLPLLSFDYFLQSVEKIVTQWRVTRRNKDTTLVGLTARGSKNTDGSITYGERHLNRSTEEITTAAQLDGRQLLNQIGKSRPLDAQSIATFVQLLKYLRTINVDVLLVLPPFHPETFGYLKRHDDGKTLQRLADEVHGISQSLSVPVAGANEHLLAGCLPEEFWDGVHPRTSCIHRVIGSVVASRSAGTRK